MTPLQGVWGSTAALSVIFKLVGKDLLGQGLVCKTWHDKHKSDPNLGSYSGLVNAVGCIGRLAAAMDEHVFTDTSQNHPRTRTDNLTGKGIAIGLH